MNKNIYKVTFEVDNDKGYRYYKCVNMRYLLLNLAERDDIIVEIKKINKLPSGKELYKEIY